MSVKEAAVHAVVVKTIKDVVAEEEARAKAALADELDPGDRKGVILTDGTNVGTVSYSVGRDASSWRVTDPAALLRWAREHAPSAVQTVEQLAPWFTTPENLDGIVEQAAGEVPDGVEWVEQVGDPYVTIRQTGDQKAAVRAALASGALEASVRRALQLGAPDEHRPVESLIFDGGLETVRCSCGRLFDDAGLLRHLEEVGA